jgi:hypothetical protein
VTAGKRAHGTRVKYVQERCRCEPCTEANRVYQRNLDRERRARAYGFDIEPRLIDATEAREQLKVLRRNGIGSRTITELTGLGRTTVRKIASGATTKIRPDTLELIMSINYDDRPGNTLIPAGPTWQLLNKLVRAGHTRTEIATAIAGKPRLQIQIRRKQVRLDTARKVEQVYRELMGERALINQEKAERRAYYRARAKETQHV